VSQGILAYRKARTGPKCCSYIPAVRSGSTRMVVRGPPKGRNGGPGLSRAGDAT